MKLSDMPHPGCALFICEYGKPKYDWFWLEDDQGRWWGAKFFAGAGTGNRHASGTMAERPEKEKPRST